MKATKELIAFTVLAGVESAGIMGNACPSRVDIEKNALDPDYRDDLREAYVGGGAISLGLAGVLAWLTESAWPLAAWGIGAGGWVALCESALPVEHRLSPFKLIRQQSRNVIDSTEYRDLGSFRIIK